MKKTHTLAQTHQLHTQKQSSHSLQDKKSMHIDKCETNKHKLCSFSPKLYYHIPIYEHLVHHTLNQDSILVSML